MPSIKPAFIGATANQIRRKTKYFRKAAIVSNLYTDAGLIKNTPPYWSDNVDIKELEYFGLTKPDKPSEKSAVSIGPDDIGGTVTVFNQRFWSVEQLDGAVNLLMWDGSDWLLHSELYSEASIIRQITFTFDRTGHPIVFYRLGDNNIYAAVRDDPTDSYTISSIAAGTDPVAIYDWPQSPLQPYSDAMLFYVRSGSIFMRNASDSFATEYETPVNSETPELNIIPFTSNGSFTVPDGVYEIDVLVVAGGGGGGSRQGGGGGGGGIVTKRISVTPGQVIPLTVGAGGLGGVSGGRGQNGENSTFGDLTALGGGGGGGRTTNQAGNDGGSGGGSAGGAAAGLGSVPEGYRGGRSSFAVVVNRAGGGGGASTPGQDADDSGGDYTGDAGDGGDGLFFPLLHAYGDSGWFSGGGGGGAFNTLSVDGGGVGGNGGGGKGDGAGKTTPATPTSPGQNGQSNTGGGGGGSGSPTDNGGNGGSGIVIVAYPSGLIPPTTKALRAVTIRADGTADILYSKNADTSQHPASIVKLMCALLAYENLVDGELDSLVTIIAQDTVDPLTNSWMQLQTNDVISIKDLLYGLLLVSGNDAAKAIGRVIGAKFLPSGTASQQLSEFVTQMNVRAGELGLATAVFTSASGAGSGNRLSALDAAELITYFGANNELVDIGGSSSRLITITGTNARTYTLDNYFDPDGAIKFPEYICAKDGIWITSGNPAETSGYCYAILWRTPLGRLRATVVMNCSTPTERLEEMRSLMNYEIIREKLLEDIDVTGLRIIDAGQNVDQEVQVSYRYDDNGYSPVVVPVPEIPVTGDYYYLNSWGSCLISNYRLDVVNEPFKLGFKVRDAFFPRYTENSGSSRVDYKQDQYMFGSDGRRQFYCFISRDTRNNSAYINLWRGGGESSALFELDDFNGEWEFEFRGLNSRTTITKDGIILFDDVLARPRPNNAAPTLITFAGSLYPTNNVDTYPFHGVQYDCWIEHNGNRIDWAVQTKGAAQQPSVPGGTDMTIHNHRVQNWVRRD